MTRKVQRVFLKKFNLPYELLDESTYRERKKRPVKSPAYIDEKYLYPIRLQALQYYYSQEESLKILETVDMFQNTF